MISSARFDPLPAAWAVARGSWPTRPAAARIAQPIRGWRPGASPNENARPRAMGERPELNSGRLRTYLNRDLFSHPCFDDTTPRMGISPCGNNHWQMLSARTDYSLPHRFGAEAQQQCPCLRVDCPETHCALPVVRLGFVDHGRGDRCSSESFGI